MNILQELVKFVVHFGLKCNSDTLIKFTKDTEGMKEQMTIEHFFLDMLHNYF